MIAVLRRKKVGYLETNNKKIIKAIVDMYTDRNIYVILTFTLLIALFLPNASFGQSAIIGYGYGKMWIEELLEYPLSGFPTNEQLDRLAHVIAVGLGVIQKRLKYKTKQTTNNKLATVFKLINFNIKKRGECAEIIHIFNSSV